MDYYMRLLFIGLLALVCNTDLFAQGEKPTIQINEDAETLDLSRQIQFIPSGSKELSPSDLAHIPESRWQTFEGEQDFEGAVWGKIALYHNSDSKKDFILIAGETDRVQLYQKGQTQEWEVMRSGWATPKSQRPISEGDFKIAKFPLKLDAYAEVELLIKYENPSGKKIKPLLIAKTQKQWKLDYYQESSSFRIIMGIALGFLGIMAVYNVLTGIFSQQAVYQYYAVYIAMGWVYIMLFGGFLSNTIIGEVVFLFPLLRSLTPVIGFLGYVLFTQNFLDTRERMPRWHKTFNILKYLMVAQAFLLILVLPFTLKEAYSRQIVGLCQGISQLILLSFIIWLFVSSKTAIDRYYAFGASFFSLASIFLAYVVVSRAVAIEIGLSVEFMGLALEIIAFSLGLGHKIKLAEKEKLVAQQAMAEVLKDQNEKLESKVQERTKELVKKQEEILTQNEELHQQQEEIIAQRDYIEKQNIDLSRKNTNITDSIRYAKQIQETILPFDDRMGSFGEWMAFYEPKDLVSGDFYWYEKVGQTHLIAVIDCTGHGVPGGFMSMIGFAILNDIALKDHSKDPAKILDKLNETFLEIFQKEESEPGKGISDGMDLSICAITYQESGNAAEVSFAGAKRPLRYVLPGSNEMLEITGSRKAIGGRQIPGRIFEKHDLELPKGTAIYLDTDGFTDQHGNNGRKFGSPQVKKMLAELSQLPMQEQQMRIAETFQEHKGSQPQRDDVTILGIRI